MDAFFFPTTDDLRLFGIARVPAHATRAWILCPPFAEEEKSSRRIFTRIAQELETRGEASLLFSFRGTADSEGDLGQTDIKAWRRDLQAATREMQRRAPDSEIAFLGVRLGASLALECAEMLGARRLILIEPLLSGRSFLMQQNAKKQIRAQITGDSTKNEAAANSLPGIEDLDGWALGAAMKADLSALDLRRAAPHFGGEVSVLQVGPREEIAPPLRDFSTRLGANAKSVVKSVVMPPFWNLIDAPDPAPLLQALKAELWPASKISDGENL